MRQLLSDLRALGLADSEVASAATSVILRQRIAVNAETVMAVCHNGLGALGHLLAHSSPVIEDGTVGADSLEALGWLMAEVGDLAAVCAALASKPRQ
ncbi:MAG: hypothetical protein EOP24_19070 [Hyphomicrobiales bacterium]|nr:MAG: hypothetical protein EOP24_19070 [Hyphomicrobiales bacterium]